MRHLLLICSLLLLMISSARASEDVLLSDGKERYSLGLHLEILEDPSGKLSISEAASPGMAGRYRPSSWPSPSFGFSSSAYWVRFSIDSRCSRSRFWLLELDYPLMDRMTVYTPGPGGFVEKRYGSLLPFAGRDLDHRNLIVRLSLPQGGKTPVYLRFQNSDRMEFPLTLWSPRAFQENIYLEQFILGLYYGILFIMILYNFFLFLSIKDRPYLHYILYILAMAVFQLGQSGFLYQLLSCVTDPPPVHFISFTQGFLILAIIQFTQAFLDTKEYTRTIHKVMNVLKGITLLYLPLLLLLDYTAGILVGIGITFLLIPIDILAGVAVIRQEYRPSYYFMAAWSVMFLSGFLFLLRVLAVIPHNLFTNYILHIGTTIELILFSLGLGDRYNQMKEEKDKISHELKIAQKIHRSLIPHCMPVAEGMAAHSEYILMEEVGGDLFDFHILDGNRLGILVADVSGHGIPAAMISSMVKVSFTMQAAHAHDPALVMKGMNDILRRQLTAAFVTASYTLIDLEKRELIYAKCGHLPLYVYKKRQERIVELNPRGILISSLPMNRIEEERTPLESGDKIIILTDGIVECRNRENALFGFDGFTDFLETHHRLEAAGFARHLIQTLRHWIYPQRSFDDDITLVVIDVH